MNKRLVLTERVQYVLHYDWYTNTDEVPSQQLLAKCCQRLWYCMCRRLSTANVQLSKFYPCRPKPWSDHRAKEPM